MQINLIVFMHKKDEESLSLQTNGKKIKLANALPTELPKTLKQCYAPWLSSSHRVCNECTGLSKGCLHVYQECE